MSASIDFAFTPVNYITLYAQRTSDNSQRTSGDSKPAAEKVRNVGQSCLAAASRMTERMKDLGSWCFKVSPGTFVGTLITGLFVSFLCPHFAIGAAASTVAAFALAAIAVAGVCLTGVALMGIAYLIEKSV